MTALPAGFEIEEQPHPKRNRAGMAFRGGAMSPGTVPHDGDTLPVANGTNGRLYGVDAFELNQPGWQNGGTVDLGARARAALMGQLANGGTATPTGGETYGRPVVSIDTRNGDAGRAMVASGYAVPEPKYLSADQQRLRNYIEAQNGAIANERGAYAGQYQRPSDYRHMGAASAPITGKLPLTDKQRAEYTGVLTNPNATADTLADWYKAQGNPAANVPNIFQYQRRFGTQAPTYFQQRNALDAPVVPNTVPLPNRLIGAGNEGVASLLGFPGDVINSVERIAGLNVPEDAFGTSASIKRGFAKMGWNGAQGDASWAPQSTVERYGQAVMNAAGQAVLPFAGTMGLGARVANGGVAAARNGGVVSNVVRNVAKDAFENQAMALTGEAGGALGSGVGGQAARDLFPDNPYADFAGQLLGGVSGGLGAAHVVGRVKAGGAPGGNTVGSSAARSVEEPAPPVIKDGMAVEPITGIKAPAVKPDGSPFFGWGRDTDGAPYPMYGDAPGSARTVGPENLTKPDIRVRDAATADSARLAAQSVELPEGFEIEAPQASSLPAPRSVDRIDVRPPPLPPGFQIEQIGRPVPMGQRPTAEQVASTVRSIHPGDVVPIPSNAVGSMDEAARIGAGMYEPATVPNERSALTPYTLPGQSRPRRNPLDLAGFLRTQGGVADVGGDLRQLGIDNKPRPIDFARDEGFLGPLVSPNGQPVESAARSAWEAGYFPTHNQPPSANEFIDALHATHRGDPARVFHPDDLEAVDNYYRTRDDRHLIEQAQQEGSPLVHNLGRPIDLSDLDANSPPSSAYEDIPTKGGGRVGNIALDKLDSAEDIGRLLTNVRAKFGGFDAARRGAMTHEETRALARQLGVTPEQILKRPMGQAMNAEQGHAMASILAKSSDEVVRLARKAQGGSDADKAAFWQAATRHAAIQEQVEGARAEAGRALSAMRMVATSRDVAGRIHNIIGNAGGPERIEDAAGKILDLANSTGDPGKVSKLVRKAVTPGFGDKLTEVYINSLLSGPQTHAANFLSNSLTAALQIPEHAGASAFGAVRGGSDRVMAGELPARAFGMLQGMKEGFRAFADTMRTGAVSDHMTKVESAEQQAISGLKGKVIRTPTRALSAADEMFKGIARRSEINGAAYRQASAEGLKGDAFRDRVADLTSNPTDAMVEQSKKYARYLTFQQPLGPIGNAVTRVSQGKLMGLPVGKLVVPFVRTPANLIKFAAERSPAAPLLKDWRDDWSAGGARRDLAAAKALVGSGAGLMFYQMAKDGLVTGDAPADQDAAALKRADGWQPYSVKVGGKWVSYARLDPLSSTMGVAADLATHGNQMTEAQRERAGTIVTAAIINNLSNKTWLSGVSDLVGAIQDPVRNFGSYARNEAASIAVPGILAQIARGSDPYQRDTQTVLDAIKARVPVLSHSVPAKLDVWGRPVPRRLLPLGMSVVAPFNVSAPKNDPVTASLLAAGAHVTKPNNTIGGVKLTPQQFRQYQAEIGKFSYPAVAAAVASPDWQTMLNDERQDTVSDVMRGVRERARSNLGLNVRKGGMAFRGAPARSAPLPAGFLIEQPR